MDQEQFIYHTTKALDVARAAQNCLQATELQLKTMVSEGELNLEVLKEEIEDIRLRNQAARHQVASLRVTLQSVGVTPSNPPIFPPANEYPTMPSMFYNPSPTNSHESGLEDGDIYFEEDLSEGEEVRRSP